MFTYRHADVWTTRWPSCCSAPSFSPNPASLPAKAPPLPAHTFPVPGLSSGDPHLLVPPRAEAAVASLMIDRWCHMTTVTAACDHCEIVHLLSEVLSPYWRGGTDASCATSLMNAKLRSSSSEKWCRLPSSSPWGNGQSQTQMNWGT